MAKKTDTFQGIPRDKVRAIQRNIRRNGWASVSEEARLASIELWGGVENLGERVMRSLITEARDSSDPALQALANPLLQNFANLDQDTRRLVADASGIPIARLRGGQARLGQPTAGQQGVDTSRAELPEALQTITGGLGSGQVFDPQTNQFNPLAFQPGSAEYDSIATATRAALPADATQEEIDTAIAAAVQDAQKGEASLLTQQGLVTAEGNAVDLANARLLGGTKAQGINLVTGRREAGEADISQIGEVGRVSGETGAGINLGFAARQTEGLALLEGLGAQERRDVNQRFDARAGQISQNVTSRGLGGTTVGANLLAGSNVRRDAELARVNDRLARERFDAFTLLSGDTLGSREGQQGITTGLGLDAFNVGSGARAGNVAAGFAAEGADLLAIQNARSAESAFTTGLASTPPVPTGLQTVAGAARRFAE